MRPGTVVLGDSHATHPGGADLGVGFALLAMRLGRVVPGLVDSVWLPAALQAKVAAEPPHDPRRLADDASILAGQLAAHTDAGAGTAAGASGGAGADAEDMPAQRLRSLAARTRALRALALRASGQQGSWSDEVELAFGVRPELAEPARYLDAQARLDAVLPGPAPLAERYAAYRRAMTAPPHQLRLVVDTVTRACRRRTAAVTRLPVGETVTWDLTAGARWAAACRHLGGGRSAVALDLTGPVRLASLPGLIAHEAYPGHHTQGCRADLARVARGWIEHAITVVATPDCLIAEGAAENALGVLTEAEPGGWGAFARAEYASIGLAFDGVLATEVSNAVAPLEDVRVDAAIMLHELGRSEAEVRAHLSDFGLLSPGRVEQALAFVRHPLWRHYVATYGEGGRLVAAWLEARPETSSLAQRYARLLDEPLLPNDLAGDLLAGV